MDIRAKNLLLIAALSFQILQTGDEINEIENTGFCNNQTTIYVGNLGNNRYIAQVLTKNIRLLQGTRLLQNIQIDIESPLNSVSVVDPYVCVKTENGQVITLALRETKGIPRLAVNKSAISLVSIQCDCCIEKYWKFRLLSDTASYCYECVQRYVGTVYT